MSDGTGYMWEKWPRVEIANLRVSDEKGSGEAWFSVWLQQLVDKAEDKRGVEGFGLGYQVTCPHGPRGHLA